MLGIAVCDDEPVFAEQLSDKIKKYVPGCNIYKFFNGEDLLADKRSFDIYFLDIQMEQLNGIEIAKRLRIYDEESIIVFITGVKEYVFEAFDVAALNYLVKPVSDERLQEVLNRAIKQLEKKNGSNNQQIFVKAKDRNVILNVADILYFENQMRKISAHTTEGEIIFYGVMDNLEHEVGSLFCRCHRGYLVNLSYVTEYNSNIITLKNGEEIYLAKSRYRDFVRQYMRYLRDGGVSYV